MAVEIVNGDVIQLTLESRVNLQQNLFTFHWAFHELTTGPWSMVPTFNDLIASLQGAFGFDTAFANCMSTTVNILNYKLQVIKTSRYVYSLFPPSNANGLVASPALPQNVACVITFRGDSAEPTNISNKHLGGVPTSFVTNGQLTPLAQTSYASLGDILQQTIPSSVSPGDFEFKPIIYHRANFLFSASITSYIVGQTSRIMRRRTVGLGT